MHSEDRLAASGLYDTPNVVPWQIVSAVCDHLADRDPGFQQQVWLCYEDLFFDTFSSSFLSHYQVTTRCVLEQLLQGGNMSDKNIFNFYVMAQNIVI